jgi:hypothetical protein
MIEYGFGLFYCNTLTVMVVVSIFPSHAWRPGSNPGRSNTTQVEKSTSLQDHPLGSTSLMYFSYIM